MQYDKVDFDNQAQIAFLREELREFYNNDILKWQYYRFEGSNSTLYFVRDGNKYIASQGMIPIHLSSGEKKRLSAKSESSFLLPAYRGSRTFVDLYNYTIEQAKLDGVELIWGFTALSKVWRHKLGFDVFDGLITESELQLSLRNAVRFALTRHHTWKDRTKSIAKALTNVLKPRTTVKSTKKHSIRLICPKNKHDYFQITTVFDSWKKNHPDFICIDLSRDYLVWRITNNPLLDYTFLGLFESDSMYGFAIINTTTPYMYLVELMVNDNAKVSTAIGELVAYVKRNFRCSHFVYWASQKNSYSLLVRKSLKAYGAAESINSTMNFVLKSTNSDDLNSKKVETFYINGLWTEGFKI